MTDTGTYEDYSAKIIDNEPSAVAAQQALINLGFDLGPAGADGDWGNKSREAAAEWQRINLYANPDGEISERQLSALLHQSTYPAVFEQQKQIFDTARLAPLYENFDVGKLDYLEAPRRAIVLQHAAHLGVMEDFEQGAEEGLNTGVAIEQYLSSDARAFPGNAWCASYGSWVLDQVEMKAGLELSEFHQGNMRVQEMHDQIIRDTPQAVKTLDSYEPQAGDAMLLLGDNGLGHYTTVIAATEYAEGVYNIVTIDGNSGDSVSLNMYSIMHDPVTGKNYPAYEDSEGFIHPVLTAEATIIDISELPNYNSMNIAFNTTAAPFIPTPSSDPNFMPDANQISLLQEIIEDHRTYKGIDVAAPDVLPMEDYLGVMAEDSIIPPANTENPNNWQNQQRSASPMMPQF